MNRPSRRSGTTSRDGGTEPLINITTCLRSDASDRRVSTEPGAVHTATALEPRPPWAFYTWRRDVDTAA